MSEARKWVLASTLACIAATAGYDVQAQTTQQEDCTLRVFFQNDVDVTNAQQDSEIANFVSGSTEDVFAVRGFASNVGEANYNLRLSQRRAVRVGNVIAAQGFDYQPIPLGEAGPGAFARRAEIYRDGCAAALITQAAPSADPAGLGIGLGLLALLLGAAAAGSGGSSSTSDTQ